MKFDFRYKLKLLMRSKLSLIPFAYSLKIGCSKKKTKLSRKMLLKGNKRRCKESTIRGQRKNLSPRWNLNPRPLCSRLDALNSDTEDSLACKGHFCGLDLQTASHSHAVHRKQHIKA